MNRRLIDWIWHVRGSVALPSGQTEGEAFARLDPLFRERGTSHDRVGGTLTFHKKDQPAQDKMAVFDAGILQIESGAAGRELRYDLASRSLLFCFLAPFLFLGFALFIQVAMPPQKHKGETASESAKADKDDADVPMNPIDKFLGAPAPDKKNKSDEDGKTGKGKPPSPTPAYVFAVLFAILYVVGRVLEARLVRSLFRKSLAGEPPPAREASWADSEDRDRRNYYA